MEIKKILNEDFDYENDSWDDGEVEQGKSFFEDGYDWTWIRRISDVIHLDFDNWAVWMAFRPEDENNPEGRNVVAFFIVDEDTGFIDWGPCDTYEEAKEFLDSKVQDWENDEFLNEDLSYYQDRVKKLLASELVDTVEEAEINGNEAFKVKANSGKVIYLVPSTLSQVDVYDENGKQLDRLAFWYEIVDEYLNDGEIGFIYELVGGECDGTYTKEEVESLPCFSGKYTDDQSDIRAKGGFTSRPELDNQPKLNGYLGPMHNGYTDDHRMVLRYETQDVYDMLSESEEDKPYTKEQILDELKRETKNFTLEKDTIRYGYEAEAEAAKEILSKHYEVEDPKKEGNWFIISFYKEELKESFPTRSGINLDQVAIRVANLLEEDKLGDNWIEVVRVRDARPHFDGEEIIFLDCIGADEVERRVTLTTNKGDIDVRFRNGSEARCNDEREIARFIAGEYGLNLNESTNPADLTDCPECGDVSFDPRKGRCTKCSYRESLDEWLGESKCIKESRKSIDDILNTLGGHADFYEFLKDTIEAYPGIEDDIDEIVSIIWDEDLGVDEDELSSAIEYIIDDVLNESKSIKEDFNKYRDEEGHLLADKWYASVYPDDEIGIEQLNGLTMDDILKDRKLIDHCDTQVRDRVYKQLDKYSPIIRECRSIEEDFSDDYIYLFPELTDDDIKMMAGYNIKYLGMNHGPDGSEDNWVVYGRKEDIEKYAENYLGYELHPDYLYEYDDFAGEIVN